MQEQVFFDEEGVRVTNARFVAHGQTYTMSGVTSVKHGKKDPERLAPVALLLIGLGMLFVMKNLLALLVLIIAGIWLALQKADHTVMLSSASGEVEALTSKDDGYIANIIEALNESIIHRG